MKRIIKNFVLCMSVSLLASATLFGCGKKESLPEGTTYAGSFSETVAEEIEEPATPTEAEEMEEPAMSTETEEMEEPAMPAETEEIEESATPTETPTDSENSALLETYDMALKDGEMDVTVEWEDNDAVKALYEQACAGPVLVDMHLYGGFEQVGSLGFSLPTEDAERKTEPGELVLYQGNQLVAFYGSNTWSYTPIGKITGKTNEELMLLLGGKDVQFSITAKGAPHLCTYTIDSIHPVNGRQGICVEGDYYWVSGSTTLTKYDQDWNIIAENEDPFQGFDLEVNHIGDIDVYQNELYLGVEYFMDGVGSNIQVAVYDGDTLELKRVFPFREDTGQLECSGIAVDPDSRTIYMSSWIDDVSSRYLYMYDLDTEEYKGALEMDPAPKWIQGVAYHDGSLFVTSDDGDADKEEPDNMYRLSIDSNRQKTIVTLERSFTDVTRQGEIEGLSFDKERNRLLLLYNRGARIVQGMPSGFYDGYSEEIHEVFVYARNTG